MDTPNIRIAILDTGRAPPEDLNATRQPCRRFGPLGIWVRSMRDIQLLTKP